jgi:hypothetical protein
VKDLAPTNLAYSAPIATYTVGTAIAPNLATHGGGAVVSYSVAPVLPAGLGFNATSGAITGTPLASAPTATYTVTATNSGGNATSTLTLTVNDPPPIAPSFTTQPAPQAVTAPATATFSAAVSGTPTPTLQWQRSVNGGTTWVDLAGATSSSYMTPATTGTDNGTQFRVVATNTAGSLVSAAATLTVTSLGKAWQTAGPVSADIPGGVMEPHIALDAQGNALAIWIHNDAGVNRYDLWANRYVAGAGWGTAQVIFPGVGTRVNRPQLGMDANGKALVVWELMDDPYDPRPHIWSIRFDPATGWGTASGIDNDSGTFISGSPKLAVAANGTAVALWTQGDSLTVVNICMAVGSTGTGLVVSTALATAPIAQGPGGPELALNAQGNGVAIWQQSNGTVITLRAATLSGGIAGAAQVISANTGNLSNPHVAVNADGMAVAVWAQGNGSRGEIAANRYVPGSGWASPSQVNSPGWTPFNQPTDPQVILDDAGMATALWVEGTGASSPKVWNHQSNAGWGMPEIISYTLGDYQMAGNGVGQILGARFSGQSIYGSPAYLVTVGDWGAGTLLTSAGYLPLKVAMDPSGNGLAVWIQPTTGGYTLSGSAYR